MVTTGIEELTMSRALIADDALDRAWLPAAVNCWNMAGEEDREDRDLILDFTPWFLGPDHCFTAQSSAGNPWEYCTSPTEEAYQLSQPQSSLGVWSPQAPPSLAAPAHSISLGAGEDESKGLQSLLSHYPHHFDHPLQVPPLQQAFVPSTLINIDNNTGCKAAEQNVTNGSWTTPADMTRLDFAHGLIPSSSTCTSPAACTGDAATLSAEIHRFHSVLYAPTAIIKEANNRSVTYLNKGHVYLLSVADTLPTVPLPSGTTFRTSVRISFEGDEQRQMPWLAWSRWRERRETNKARPQRVDHAQAVEYVGAGHMIEGDNNRTPVELETASLDGFSVLWTPCTETVPEVRVLLRFHFLSTDFSYSKGVKGTAVRLCVKTSPLTVDESSSRPEPTVQTDYCLVKLFRDHGAERKQASDAALVTRSIDKIQQWILQTQSNLQGLDDRKQAAEGLKCSQVKHPDTTRKHTRPWAALKGSRTRSSASLHEEVRRLRCMRASSIPTSVLDLQGGHQDDLNEQPVSTHGDFRRETLGSSSLGLRVPVQGAGGHCHKNKAMPTDDAPCEVVDQPAKIRVTHKANSPGFIEAVGVDWSYEAPPERQPKPAACFYVRSQRDVGDSSRTYHYAVYILQCSLKHLNDGLVKKFKLDPAKLIKTIHVQYDGLEADMDDEAVRKLRDGQVMVLQVEDLEPLVHRERAMASGADTNETAGTVGGLVLRLIY